MPITSVKKGMESILKEAAEPYPMPSMVVRSSGLRLRLAGELRQISPWTLEETAEVASMKVRAELMPSRSNFSASARSAIVFALEPYYDMRSGQGCGNSDRGDTNESRKIPAVLVAVSGKNDCSRRVCCGPILWTG